ncbi:MAG: HD domain-containing protein [Lachnospiraceae bacterium]|nr:HD domain-containing protein [Lachnospiraceae bacterium]
MLNEAIIFATKAHAGQVRKATRIPYILHPMECAVIVSAMTMDEEMIAAAVLHDTVEDCKGVTIDVIREQFGERVAHYVARESEDKSKSWQERKQATIEHLQNAPMDECILVLADKLSNLRSIARDYKVFGDDLWNRFNEKRKERIGWYYRSIGEAISCLCEYEEYKEYQCLLQQVFGEE